MIYFTADQHFGHKNIIRYCGRPYAHTREMDEDMIRRWNEVVTDEDVVYHLGDFALVSSKRLYRYTSRLRGQLHLVIGNHDKTAAKMRRGGFRDVVKRLVLPGAHGEPAIIARHSPHDFTLEDRAPLLLCGHVHEAWKAKTPFHIGRRVINVGVDVWGFAPVSLTTLREWRKQIELDPDRTIGRPGPKEEGPGRDRS